MRENDVTKRVVKYISDNHISINQIAKATNIPVKKLVEGGQELNATEFLELCFFLNVRPEDFMTSNLKV